LHPVRLLNGFEHAFRREAMRAGFVVQPVCTTTLGESASNRAVR
jgi:hypothetical protein